jgi:hypothetical protein
MIGRDRNDDRTGNLAPEGEHAERNAIEVQVKLR